MRADIKKRKKKEMFLFFVLETVERDNEVHVVEETHEEGVYENHFIDNVLRRVQKKHL